VNDVTYSHEWCDIYCDVCVCVCVCVCVQVRVKPSLPPLDNDNLDEDTAADIAWKQERQCDDSIVADLFGVCVFAVFSLCTFLYLSLLSPMSTYGMAIHHYSE